MDISGFRHNNLVAVILGDSAHQEQILSCLRALAGRWVPYSIHCLKQDEKIAREELDILATTAVKVIIVADRITDSRNHLPGFVASCVAEHQIIVIGVSLPESTVTLQDIHTPNHTSLVWSTGINSGYNAGVTAATIMVTSQMIKEVNLLDS